MSNTESKEYVLKRLDEEWPKFRALVESVPETEYDRPGALEEWCLKELLGHVSFWAAKAAGDIALAAEGRPQDIQTPGNQENVDKWNAREAARGKAMQAGELKVTLTASHEAAKSALESTPESAMAIEVDGWTVGVRFAEDTYRHYREHGQHIGAWARELETSEA